ncbi:hypothetical protein LXL04_024697 [Taraxacum kok-saghyz]
MWVCVRTAGYLPPPLVEWKPFSSFVTLLPDLFFILLLLTHNFDNKVFASIFLECSTIYILFQLLKLGKQNLKTFLALSDRRFRSSGFESRLMLSINYDQIRSVQFLDQITTIHQERHQHHIVVSISSVEAEYHKVANVVAETCWLTWLHKLLHEFQCSSLKATVVCCHNINVVYMYANHVQHNPRNTSILTSHYVFIRLS